MTVIASAKTIESSQRFSAAPSSAHPTHTCRAVNIRTAHDRALLRIRRPPNVGSTQFSPTSTGGLNVCCVAPPPRGLHPLPVRRRGSIPLRRLVTDRDVTRCCLLHRVQFFKVPCCNIGGGVPISVWRYHQGCRLCIGLPRP